MKKTYMKPVMTTVKIQHEMALLTTSSVGVSSESKTFGFGDGEEEND